MSKQYKPLQIDQLLKSNHLRIAESNSPSYYAFNCPAEHYLYQMTVLLDGDYDDLEDFKNMRLAASKLIEILDKDIKSMESEFGL